MLVTARPFCGTAVTVRGHVSAHATFHFFVGGSFHHDGCSTRTWYQCDVIALWPFFLWWRAPSLVQPLRRRFGFRHDCFRGQPCVHHLPGGTDTVWTSTSVGCGPRIRRARAHAGRPRCNHTRASRSLSDLVVSRWWSRSIILNMKPCRLAEAQVVLSGIGLITSIVCPLAPKVCTTMTWFEWLKAIIVGGVVC